MSLPGFLVRNWRLKGISLALASLLWVAMQLREEADTGRRDLPNVEVRIENGDPRWMASGAPSPATVSIGVHGTFGDLFRAALARPVVVIPVDSVPGQDSVFQLEPNWVANLDQDRVAIDGFNPSTVRQRFERNTSEPVPVSYRTIGAVPDSLAMTGALRVNPLFTQVRGPASLVDDMETVFLEPFDLGALTGPGRFDVAVDTAGLGGVSVSPSTAVLTVEVATRGRRLVGPLPVEPPEGVEDLEAAPASVIVTLHGAEPLLAEADTTALRVRAVLPALERAAARARLEAGEEEHVPLVVEGVPPDSWLEWTLEVDSVAVRRRASAGREQTTEPRPRGA